MQNKLTVLLGVLFASFLISTIVVAVQKNNLKAELQKCDGQECSGTTNPTTVSTSTTTTTTTTKTPTSESPGPVK